MILRKRFSLLILMVLVLVFAVGPHVFAGDKPLTLKSSDPADGAEGVERETSIVLGFSKNVVNFLIAEDNKKCFSLATEEGNPVEIEVEMADDQLYPEKKREIIIDPVDLLEGNTGYVLTISPDLRAKNGNTLGKQGEIRFTTGG